MFALAMFGSILEKYIGSKKFLIVFFSAGIISSIADILFYSATLGTSGAIFGLLGALTVIRPKQVVWALGVPMYIVIAAFVWVGVDLAGLFSPDGTAHAAHLFGMGGGFASGFLLRSRYTEPKRPKKKEIISDRELDEWEEKYMK